MKVTLNRFYCSPATLNGALLSDLGDENCRWMDMTFPK
jgi:hypothetical protein